MDKFGSWLNRHKPGRRRLIQVYAALLYNAYLKGFADGEIYRGILKHACVPGLNCYSCPGAVGACPLGALQDALANSDARAPAFALGIVLLFGLLLGRTVCGFLCPVGLIQELLYKTPVPKVKKSRFTRALSHLKYVILAVFVVGIPVVQGIKGIPVPEFCRTICPAGTLEGAIGLLSNPANAERLGMLGFLFTRKFVILVIFCAGSMFIFRFFCRFFCPLGAIYGLFARIALPGVKVDAGKCTGCGSCVAHCRMDVRRVGDRECIQCGECAGVCPEQAIRWKGGRIILRANEAGKPPKKSARRTLAIVLAAALLLGVGVFVNLIEEPPTVSEEALGDADVVGVCPDFTLPLYGGGEFRLAEQRGRVVVLNFWATWCAPCLEELPGFEAIAAKYPEDVTVLGIHAQMTTEDVQAFLDARGCSIPMAYDADGTVLAEVGDSVILPVTVLVDREGRIFCNWVGSMDAAELEMLVQSRL